jgi:hypothetical protein
VAALYTYIRGRKAVDGEEAELPIELRSPYILTASALPKLCFSCCVPAPPLSTHPLRLLSANMSATCPSDNAPAVDQSDFWDASGIHWDQHRIGWAIAGGCAALVRPRPPYRFDPHG